MPYDSMTGNWPLALDIVRLVLFSVVHITLFQYGFLFFSNLVVWLILLLSRWKWYAPLKPWALSKLHGVTIKDHILHSHSIRTSNPTSNMFCSSIIYRDPIHGFHEISTCRQTVAIQASLPSLVCWKFIIKK